MLKTNSEAQSLANMSNGFGFKQHDTHIDYCTSFDNSGSVVASGGILFLPCKKSPPHLKLNMAKEENRKYLFQDKITGQALLYQRYITNTNTVIWEFF